MEKYPINFGRVKGNLEIERKFLITQQLPPLLNGKKIRQAYIFIEERKELRIRLTDQRCFMNIKVELNELIKEEFEYELPSEEGQRIIDIASLFPPIEKTRYVLNHSQLNWEIDVFDGLNQGLVLAEVELTEPGQSITKPDWIGIEVTHDKRYYNANLYKNPYKNWKNAENDYQ